MKRSLFLKIFVWFWLAMCVLVGVVVLLLAGREPSGDLLRALTGQSLATDAQTAAALLEEQGTDALHSFVANLEERQVGPTYLFDGIGNEALGRTAPPEASELAMRAAKSERSEFHLTWGGSFGAQAVTSDRGNRYVLVRTLPTRPGSRVSTWLWNRLLRSEPQVVLLRIGLLFLATGLVCFALARYLTAPLIRLRAASLQLAGGNLQARVGEPVQGRNDEIAELGEAFNHMAARLEALVNSQRRLLADISHELRSPLARLNIALALARRPGSDSQTALDRAEREVERLDALIGELLTLSRLQSGVHSARRDRLDLAELLRAVAADGDFEARDRNGSVRLAVCDECRMTGDEELLRRALENVLRNAIHYTADNTEVELTLRCEPRTQGADARITVRDHGPGVPAEALPRLFMAFYRAPGSAEKRMDGSGLGLAIAEQAVKLHGGSIAARSASGGGLLVEIRLPLEGAAK